MDEIIKVDGISKVYRLGQIGTGTLGRDLQSAFARLLKKEDPNTKIGSKKHLKNESFVALDDVSFSVKRGETIGIIGRNGAGKSTLLKILSRITAPTQGSAVLNGRVSSMLEVGTGFHAELTGRENIYLNGAILGMTKSEVDERLDDIIKFSECEEFIDTPIKRYSSGMFVKLGFAVAAHLSSEILIMDEVLSVGDMNFIKKCVEKMRLIAENENRTILYVSHNMDTVRNLCSRTIVLDKGKIIFDGDTEKAIEIYLGSSNENCTFMDFSNEKRHPSLIGKERIIKLESAQYSSLLTTLGDDGKLSIDMTFSKYKDIDDLGFRLTVYDSALKSVATSFVYDFCTGTFESKKYNFTFDMSTLAPGRYETRYTFFRRFGVREDLESFMGLSFNVGENENNAGTQWRKAPWGSVILPSPSVKIRD